MPDSFLNEYKHQQADGPQNPRKLETLWLKFKFDLLLHLTLPA